MGVSWAVSFAEIPACAGPFARPGLHPRRGASIAAGDLRRRRDAGQHYE